MSFAWMNDFFYPPGKLTSWQQYAAPALDTFQTNIRAQTNHFPFITTAWMRFPQAKDVIQVDFGQHRWALYPGKEAMV